MSVRELAAAGPGNPGLNPAADAAAGWDAGGGPVDERGALLRALGLAKSEWWRLTAAILLGALATGSGVALMATSAFLISRASQQPPILSLGVAIVAVRFFGISRAVFRYAERLVGHDAAFRVLADTRVTVYQRLADLAPAGLPAQRSGDLLARVVDDVDELQQLYLRILPAYAVAALVGGASAWIVGSLVPSAGLLLAAGLATAGLVVPWLARGLSARAARSTAGLRGDVAAGAVELVEALPELIAYDAVDERLARLAATDAALVAAERRTSAGAGLGAGLTTLVSGATVVGCLMLGTRAVTDDLLLGVALATVVLTPLAAFEVVAPLPMAAQLVPRVRRAAARLFALADATVPVVDPPAPAAAPEPPTPLVAQQLSAAWPGHDAVLHDVDLDLPAGRRVAVVGPSGSGKSTLAMVLLRFLPATAGRVTLAGTDVADLTGDQVRRAVGLLAQDAHVFGTTVEENLRIARPDATAEQLREALARARLLDWVDGLPDGLATEVGERGARMSGGQRQRLALARALLADWPVLVLDEPGEHLDLPTADALTADLLTLTDDRSTVVITHRLAGLEAVDEILVLDGGRVVERGGHDDLLAASGAYATLWGLEEANRPSG